MKISGASDIITAIDNRELDSGETIQVLTLRDNKVMIITETAIGLYNSLEFFLDPLADGKLAYADLPEGQTLNWSNGSIVQEYKAGYIGLSDNKVILITPNAIRLFSNKHNALRNLDAIVQLDIATPASANDQGC